MNKNNNELQKYFDILEISSMPEFLKRYLNVPCLVRLKDVGYFCGMDYASKDIYDFKLKITRYDHSLSVALITWKFTHDKKSTLAGLFHDIATPCFAHVIDYMNGDYEKQESTEEYTNIILRSDKKLFKLLEEDNLTIEDISNFKEYTIVDNDRPKLCADRLDGVILTGLAWTKSIDTNDIEKIIRDIHVYQNENKEFELGFKSYEISELTIETSNLIDYYCHTKEDNYMMELLAEITKLAIKNSIISYYDLYILNEYELINKLEKCNITEIEKLVNKFKNIKSEEIPYIELENVKVRKLIPLVNNIRVSNI